MHTARATHGALGATRARASYRPRARDGGRGHPHPRRRRCARPGRRRRRAGAHAWLARGGAPDAPSPWERVASPCFQEGHVVVALTWSRGAPAAGARPGGVAQAMGHARQRRRRVRGGAEDAHLCARQRARRACVRVFAPAHVAPTRSRATHACTWPDVRTLAHISVRYPSAPRSQAGERANTATQACGCACRRLRPPSRSASSRSRHAWRGRHRGRRARPTYQFGGARCRLRGGGRCVRHGRARARRRSRARARRGGLQRRSALAAARRPSSRARCARPTVTCEVDCDARHSRAARGRRVRVDAAASRRPRRDARRRCC